MYKRNWVIHPIINGFEMILLVRGTEDEVRQYMEFEFGYMPAYRGVTDAEVDVLKRLGVKTYIA